MTPPATDDATRVGADPAASLSVHLSGIARMLNAELADDPVYDGFELQWYDDPVHGTGLLAFLSRRADRVVDFYVQPGLNLDRDGFRIGGGIGAWIETDFVVARLEITEDGVDAEVDFTDVDGRDVSIRIDDRDGRPRRRARLLAPVGAGIEHPSALLLVWMHGFDLVRAGTSAPQIRIGGRDASTGRLPGARLHRRHLIKYAGPLCAVEVNRSHTGPLPSSGDHRLAHDADGRTNGIVAEQGGHRVRLVLDPPLPGDGGTREPAAGRWHIVVDDTRLTGGPWWVRPVEAGLDLGFDVDERWRPGRLPWLMRVVTTVMPVFRRWPTTYRWRARMDVGPPATLDARWERTDLDAGRAYRRATRS